MNNGFITLHRKILDNPIWKNSQLSHLFIHLLFLATYEQDKFIWNGKEQVLERGQLITGRFSLSKSTGIPVGSIPRYLDTLRKLKIVNIKSNNRFSLITIVKYSDYQDKKEKRTPKRTTSEHLANTHNKDNKENKDISEDKPRSSNSFKGLQDFLDSPQKHIRLIGFFFKRKGVAYTTPEEWTQAGKRWMRTAVMLSKFESDKITSAFDKAEEWKEWQLDTVYKKITSQNLNDT